MTNSERQAQRKLAPGERQALIAKYLLVHAEGRASEPRIPRRAANTVPPLSWGQQQILLHSEIAEGIPLYNEAVVIHRDGPVDTAALECALNEFIRRHEIMRTAFPSVNGQTIQAVQPGLTIQLPVEDLEHLSEPVRESEAIRMTIEDVKRPFDIVSGPLFRVRLLRFHDKEYRLLIALHHTIFDGAAIAGVLLPELVSLYESAASGALSLMSEPALQYSDYACWQREHIVADRLKDQLEYWRKQLARDIRILDLPIDRPRPSTPSFQGAMVPFCIPSEVCEALKTLARENGATPYIVLLAAYYALLYRYTYQENIVIGSIQSVRNRSELEPLMGYFLNTLALRLDLAGNPSFRELVARVRDVTLDSFSHADIPFSELVGKFDSRRDPDRTPFFDVFFSMNPSPVGELPGWDVTHLDVEVGISKFDLHLEIDVRPDGMTGRFLFKTALFERSTIERMSMNWETLLAGIAAAPDRRLDELPVLSNAERQRILLEWNDTRRPYADSVVHELVEAQADRTPQAVAVTFEGQRLTYRELNQRANRLACWLVENGAGTDVLIGICMERSLEMAVSLLAILKAGAAFVPLDPENPVQRLSDLISDSNPLAILTQSKFSKLPAFQNRCLLAVDSAAGDFEGKSYLNLGVRVRPGDLAYVIYTSGSTGQPKGVMVPHRGICNRMLWMQEAWPLSSCDRVLQKTPYFFDVSVPEFFGTWMAGATLVIARPGGHRDAGYLARTIVAERITQVHFVPSQLQLFLDEPGVKNCRGLRRLICSGEALTVDLERSFHARLNATLLNLYGPTEASVEVSAIERTRHETGPMTIGRPIANTKLYVLDRKLQPAPIGVVGELYIGGVQVARGYLKRPELTAEYFVRDPFDNTSGARRYRTGDRARFLADGQIEFLGRLDSQIKIRGFRVELGEIEEAIRRFSGVGACAVIARAEPSGQKCLVAHVEAPAMRADGLDNHLRRMLPEYMIPQRYVFVDRLPLGPSGKVDRGSLQAVELCGPFAIEPVAPRNQIERELTRIWGEVLQVNSIGITQNFFTLGGNSLLVARLIQRIERRFGKRFSMAALFQAPTIEEFGKFLGNSGGVRPMTRVISIQPNGQRPPLFLCMDGGPMYRELADCLGPDQPLFGITLEQADLDDLDIPYRLEDLALLLARTIREAQPHGPYYLAGWCLSGVIAYETARQLTLAGDHVALVTLFDAANIGYYKRLSLLARAAALASKVTYHLDQFRRVETRPQYLQQLLDELGQKYVRMRWTFSGHRQRLGFLERLTTATTGFLAARAYSARPYDGRVVSFIPKQRAGGKYWNFSTSWAEPASRLETYEVPGNHTTMFEAPHVMALADCLMRCLRTPEVPQSRAGGV